MQKKGQNSPNGVHAQRLKAIRPFVNFDYNLNQPLTPYQKRKIRRYWDQIHRLTARPHQVYRPRRKDHLKSAQEFAQHTDNLPELKVAFIPTSGSEKVKVRFDKTGNAYTTSEHIKSRLIRIDPKQLVAEGVPYIEKLIADAPEDAFTLLSAEFEIPIGLSKAVVGMKAAELMEKYGDKDKNNYYANWLFGINAYTFTNQEFGVYLLAKQKKKKAMQRKRRNKKRSEKRAAETRQINKEVRRELARRGIKRPKK